MRDAALSLSLDFDWAGEFANPRQMQPYTYADGGAVLAGNGTPESLTLGAVLPDERLSATDYFSDLFGNGFSLAVLQGTLPEGIDALREKLTVLREEDFPVPLCSVTLQVVAFISS